MNINFIDRTHYFTRATTWIKRLTFIGLLSLIILTRDFEYAFIQYGLLTFISFIVLTYRKDDIALDTKYFYHLRTSIIPSLSKIEKFEIAAIESIRYKGFDSWIWKLKGGKSMRGSDSGIEITFKDNTSVSLDVDIYKKDLGRIIGKVRIIMRKKRQEED